MPFEISGGNGIPAGQYKGQLLRVESGTGKFGDQRNWFFGIDIDGELKEHKEITSTNTGPGSKARQYLEGLMGRELKTGEVIEDPTGVTALFTFEQKPNGYTKIASIVPIVEPAQVEAGLPR